jgi:hypothetical protein
MTAIARHPVVFGVAVFVAMQLWPLHCAAIGLAIVAVIVTRTALDRQHALATWQAAQRRALARRADYEHRMALAGDPRGVHGQYPPAYPTAQRAQRI